MTNPLPTEEGAQESEQPIVEARVVPDEPVEQAQEPTVAPDVSEGGNAGRGAGADGDTAGR